MNLHRKQFRSGFSMLYVVIFMTVGLAMASLAVDWGRVELAKTQLRQAADAAARAGAVSLGSVSAVQAAAIQYAGYNSCDGSTVAITSSDIDFLDWNTTTRTYTVLTGSSRNYANAVRVIAKRTGSSGIPLMFAKFAGYATKDVQATAIVCMVPPGYGLVGLNYIKLNGNSSASYWATTGTVGGNAGNIASNGNVTSTGNATISGTVWTLSGATVSGVTANARRTLTSPLVYANGTSSPYGTGNNDNGLLPAGVLSSSSVTVGNNKTYSIPAGHYLVNNFTINNSGVINLLGPVTFYVYGSISLNGQASAAASQPTNLKIVMVPNPYNGNPPGTINITSGSALYADIYGPQSDITLGGTGSLYGTIIGKSVTMSGSSDIYYDLTLAGNNNIIQAVQ